MRKIKDKNFDYKSIVIDGYNNCAIKYQNARIKDNEKSLFYILDKLEPNSKVLDIGCGCGIPIDKLLAKKYNVTGIDISPKQIELAKQNVKNANYMNIDFLDYTEKDGTFDCIVSYYTLFHLPREKHRLFIKKCYNLLKSNGYIIITVGADNESAYLEDDFFDTTMYWSNFGMNEYIEIFIEIGFTILKQEILDHGFENKEMEESHPIIFAQK